MEHPLMTLPAFGPYTKRYMGISHIPADELGARFDLSIFPALYRRKIDVPNVNYESGWHPWEAAPDLSYYRYRCEVEWKDGVYADISFAQMGEGARLIACDLVNNTGRTVSLALHAMASIHHPTARAHDKTPIRTARACLPESASLMHALDYRAFAYKTPRPSDHLVTDGWMRGEAREHGFLDGAGIGCGFGGEAGDRVSYELILPATLADASVCLYARASSHAAFDVIVDGCRKGAVVIGCAEFSVCSVGVGALSKGAHVVEVVGTGTAAQIGAVMVCESTDASAIRFEANDPNLRPETEEFGDSGFALDYQGVPARYGVLFRAQSAQIRRVLTSELDDYFRFMAHNHVSKVLTGDGRGCYDNIFMRPYALKSGETRTIYGVIAAGDPAAVSAALAAFGSMSDAGCAAHMEQARTRAALLSRSDDPYAFSQRLMAATVLTNVVYPVYTRRTFIKHNTPGRWWDCLYTWDSGMLGLGLLQYDLRRALECLQTYLTPVGDEHCAFIHHGSMVPTQFALAIELMNRGLGKDAMAFLYPRMKQYYDFYTGKAGGSTMRMPSGLLRSWDYFYNSGGWDDYAPQKTVHQLGLSKRTAPMVNTCHAIIASRALEMMADALGVSGDQDVYRADREAFAAAMQTHAWDEDAGFFGYVLHDETGSVTGLLRHEPSGQNHNMGLDGLYPMVVGAVTKEQNERMRQTLLSPRLLTPVGLTTVDTTAAYYTRDGYWNGAVWMPHQWFFFKGLLDDGDARGAERIAKRGLDVWAAEADESYLCFEHFMVEGGRGAGWHHFSGLSSPVCDWYSTYYQPFRLTVGLRTRVLSFKNCPDDFSLTAELKHYGAHAPVILACMPAGRLYAATWNGQPVNVGYAFSGALEIRLDGAEQGVLEITPI